MIMNIGARGMKELAWKEIAITNALSLINYSCLIQLPKES